ncbi:RNA dependent RNA polymerase-domain-containing protein [Lineolata rhizophorae]|uniref:RNA-dependent RNA polymerase n=1 Tax=Lineolata rhizophorae TaxID=578093 RepID=A0A6A6P6T9_9PEZI|nr:RNA dependent RNA polymerase-domain-containing protein [Lineolata rhizophorae]
MEVFAWRIPPQWNDKKLTVFLRSHLAKLNIHTYSCRLTKNRGCAIISFVSKSDGSKFLNIYGEVSAQNTRQRIGIQGQTFVFKESKFAIDDMLRHALQYQEERRVQSMSKIPALAQPHNKCKRHYQFKSLDCGVWAYAGTTLVFKSYFRDSRAGDLAFGDASLVLFLRNQASTVEYKYNDMAFIEADYYSIQSVIIGYDPRPTLTFTFKNPPKISTRTWIKETRSQQNVVKKRRMPGVTEQHHSTAGSCFVYRIVILNENSIYAIQNTFLRNPALPSASFQDVKFRSSPKSFSEELKDLEQTLSSQTYLSMPFQIKFQLYRVTINGWMAPAKVQALIPNVNALQLAYGSDTISEGLRKFCEDIPVPGPETTAEQLEMRELSKVLIECIKSPKQANSIYRIQEKHKHLALIHRVKVTPTGIALEGPCLEAKNRVLRLYDKYMEFFIRVDFCEEDGEKLTNERDVCLSLILDTRFKAVLNDGIQIADRHFSFLGFSHSSLRTQSCWFMAPFVQDRQMTLAQNVIKSLGEFTEIRTPAKCAARIGQAFSDTRYAKTIPKEAIVKIPDVERNGYVFSDGVGVISPKLLKKTIKALNLTRGVKPTVLQIRFAGAKGVVSIDSRLEGDQLCLRPSMIKFEAPNTFDIEICGSNEVPLPMYLNRPLVKILEDLGVPASNLLRLQEDMINELKELTYNPVNAATFLEFNYVNGCADPSGLIRRLNDIGLNFHDDPFLRSLVEITAVMQLRDIKHRARILVKNAHTLYGIMDESGYLKEGQIYCTVIDRNGVRKVYVQNNVMITRSPAMDPGDVQLVQAVDVPANSPLNSLQNVIVFSSKGDRDLPSCLSGGDLDGDLYNVIFDKKLIPKRAYNPASYARPRLNELSRPVLPRDITDFFIHFMKNDKLGMLSNAHMQIADRNPEGTVFPDCVRLAEMCSTAVDFSKTGIEVDMSTCPKYDRFKPDFMASGPRLIVLDNHITGFQEDAFIDGDDEEDNPLEDILPRHLPKMFYKSDRVLGQLYRAVDEEQFLTSLKVSPMKSNGNGLVTYTSNGSSNVNNKPLMQRLWAYVERETRGLQWKHHEPIARSIRATYEYNVKSIMYDYQPLPGSPLTELETYAGFVLGRKRGSDRSRRLREMSKSLKERFDRDVAATVEEIMFGEGGFREDDQQGAEDYDDYDDDEEDLASGMGGLKLNGHDGGGEEALVRAVACLYVGMEADTDENMGGQKRRRVRSFQYVAAAVCLRELERWQNVFGPLRRI